MFIVIKYTKDKSVGYSVAEFNSKKLAENYIEEQEKQYIFKSTFVVKEI